MKRFVAVVAAMALLVVVACHPGVPATAQKDITVGAAVSLSDVLKTVAQDYSSLRPGTRVYLSLGASSTIARQIQAGAPIDIFFSADRDQMDLLEKSGLLVAGSRTDLLTNRLAFIVSEKRWEKRQRLEEILGDEAAVPAICDPSVPIGHYAADYLKKTGWYDTLAPRAVKLDNARALVSAVDSGNADIALVFETDAAAARTARVIRVVPANEGPDIVYPVAVVKSSRSIAESQALIDFLKSPAGATRFRDAGFTALANTNANN